MIVIANEEDLRPKILVQTMLGLDYGEVVASRDHAPIEDDQVVLLRVKNDRGLGPGAQGKTGEKDGTVICGFAEETRIHAKDSLYRTYGGYSIAGTRLESFIFINSHISLQASSETNAHFPYAAPMRKSGL